MRVDTRQIIYRMEMIIRIFVIAIIHNALKNFKQYMMR